VAIAKILLGEITANVIRVKIGIPIMDLIITSWLLGLMSKKTCLRQISGTAISTHKTGYEDFSKEVSLNSRRLNRCFREMEM
jgi:hypothetical protein